MQDPDRVAEQGIPGRLVQRIGSLGVDLGELRLAVPGPGGVEGYLRGRLVRQPVVPVFLPSAARVERASSWSSEATSRLVWAARSKQAESRTRPSTVPWS